MMVVGVSGMEQGARLIPIVMDVCGAARAVLAAAVLTIIISAVHFAATPTLKMFVGACFTHASPSTTVARFVVTVIRLATAFTDLEVFVVA